MVDVVESGGVIPLGFDDLKDLIEDLLIADIVLGENPHATVVHTSARNTTAGGLVCRLATGDEGPLVVTLRLESGTRVSIKQRR